MRINDPINELLTAKHLSLNNCRTAYPSLTSAKSAVQTLSSASFAPLVSLDDDRGSGGPNVNADDITSFDPSVVMAQAYQKDKRDKVADQPSAGQQGPLAFLGLQRRPSAEGTATPGGDKSSANQSSAEDEKDESDETMEEDKDNVSQ